MNRDDLVQKALSVTGRCLRTKGYVAMIDVLMAIGRLAPEDYERWRFRQTPYLEKVIHLNLNQLNEVLRAIRGNSLKGGLKASRTVFTSWGKQKREPLRFSRSGNPGIEELYSTHYLSPQTSTALPSVTL